MDKRLYIIGAGASAEVNLPIGSKLKTKIQDSLGEFDDAYGNLYPIDFDIYSAIKHYVDNNKSNGISKYIEAAKRIKLSMPLSLSIDNYIHTHRENEEIILCGKLAIVRSILEAEKDSLLFIDEYSGFDLNKLTSTWYVSFFQLLTENCTKNELSERLKQISFVIFNYDRCVEHFLFNAFKIYYDLTDDEAANFVNEIEIYHPYGIVGYLPWQNKGISIEYGEHATGENLLDIASKIQTFTEGNNPNTSDINAIHKNVHNADKIIFLGFAFHPLNLELISTNNKKFNEHGHKTKYFGTGFGLSLTDALIIEDRLKTFTFNDVDKFELELKKKCVDLFQEYWKSLSFV